MKIVANATGRIYDHGLGYHRLYDDVVPPHMATENSACFDLRAYISTLNDIKKYDVNNRKGSLPVFPGVDGDYIKVQPRDRTLIPTGLILDIPTGFFVELHIRSSLALKEGLALANSTGIIDSDYIDPVFIMIENNANFPITITNGDRIAQGRLVKLENYCLNELMEPPTQKTDRSGGFGSTGRS